MSPKSRSHSRIKNKDNIFFLIPIILLISVIPLIVYMKVDVLQGIKFEFWRGTKENLDFFSYTKSTWISIITGIGLFLFIARIITDNYSLKKTQYYIPMAAYAILILLSTIFAEYKDVALGGFPERYEGMYALLAYIIMMFLTINLVNCEKDIKWIIGALVISATIIGVIGIFQFIGYDFFRSSIGKAAMLPNKYHHIADTLNFNFGKNTIYSTLYNTNYVGSYMAMLVPISISLFLYVKDKYAKVGMGIFTALVFATWIGCRSRAGMVGGVFALLLLSIIYRRLIIKQYKSILILVISFMIIFFGMNEISDGSLFGKISTLWDEAEPINTQDTSVNVRIEDIIINSNKVAIKTNLKPITVVMEGNRLSLEDENGNQLNFHQDKENSNKLIIENEGYSIFTFELLPKHSVLKVNFSNRIIYFNISDSKLAIMGRHGKPSEIEYPEAWGFEGQETFANSRGYIWSRTFPILKDTLIIGHGPDTYPIYFPQEDFIGKLKALRDSTMLVDKPHNMYLQIAVNTGVISLIALLVMFAFYFFSSFRIYIKADTSSLISTVGVGIFAAFCGYAIAAFFNDSVVSVAPVFWILFGLGISINLKLKQDLPSSK